MGTALSILPASPRQPAVPLKPNKALAVALRASTFEAEELRSLICEFCTSAASSVHWTQSKEANLPSAVDEHYCTALVAAQRRSACIQDVHCAASRAEYAALAQRRRERTRFVDWPDVVLHLEPEKPPHSSIRSDGKVLGEKEIYEQMHFCERKTYSVL